MSSTLATLLDNALRLSPGERAELAALLIDSLDTEVDADAPAAWDAEIQRRLQDLDNDTVRPIPWTEARRMIAGTPHDATDT
jgi:putative addiction module component (TIGR02574 family)